MGRAPSLDPTVMGWKEREWYLGDHAPALFDRAGNAGPTVWWDGRIVGGWVQRRDGEVVYRLLEDVGGDALARSTPMPLPCRTGSASRAPGGARFPRRSQRERRGRVMSCF